MNSSEIRKKFLSFFSENNHKVVESDLLIPSSDPTLFFTSAGMVRFKRYFLGEEKISPPRATSCQKCFRTSDLDNIGHTTRHLSFFEMLGNFSFGDYFKKEAIDYAWEFLTKDMSLDKKRLYVTVYRDDDEAYDIWKKIVSRDRIYRLSEETNFWKMGETGPCGPCSEIIYDLGKEISCGKPDCNPECPCDRWLEVWNLVFMQFNRGADGNLTPLPNKNIDTGMGIERLCAAVNGKKNVFETDLFMPMINELESILGCKSGKDERTSVALRLVSDHIRSITFLINDGILPSNDGRGYVLRRIIRRAVRNARLLGYGKPFLFKLAGKVINIMKDAYPELALRHENIAMVIKMEEEKFLETLDTGMNLLSELIEKAKKSGRDIISGDDVFFLYDTYGFPAELTGEILAENKLKYSQDEFMKKQESARKISKASWKDLDVSETKIYRKYTATMFVGYEQFNSESVISGILKNENETDNLREGEQGDVILNTTPFYGESGGQLGDTGQIKKMDGDVASCIAEVVDTKKTAEQVVVHKVKIVKGSLKTGDRVIASVDRASRLKTMRHHTATHLLHKTLRIVLGEHATQSGSLVSPDGFRFDFAHFKALSGEEVKRIEYLVNEKIMECMPVNVVEIPVKEARKYNAMALFGEKYQDIVRCVYTGAKPESSYSVELCGGTHCKNTGEIGLFKITGESSVGSGLRRMEGLCGDVAIGYFDKREDLLNSVSQALRSTPDELEKKVDALLKQQKQLQQEIENLRTGTGLTGTGEDEYKIKGNIKLIVKKLSDTGLEQKNLRTLADNVRDRFKADTVVMVVNVAQDKVSFVLNATQDVVAGGFDVSKFAKDFAAKIDGQAGGRKDFAQGGCKDPAKFEQALKELNK